MSIASVFSTARRKAQERYNTYKSRRAYEDKYPDEARKELAAQQKIQASRQALKEEKSAALKARLGRFASAVSGPTQQAVAKGRMNERTTINPAFDTSSGNIFTRENTFTIGRQSEPHKPKKTGRTIVIKL